MSGLISLILVGLCTYFGARMMKQSGRSWVLGAILGFFFNVLGLLVVFILKKGVSGWKLGGTKRRKRRSSKVEKFATAQLGQLLEYSRTSLEDFEIGLESINDAIDKDLNNQLLLEIHSVELREVRAGTSVAETSGSIQGKTRSGTIGLSGRHVGVAASSGSFDGRLRSTTITPPAPESLQKIDDGKVLIRRDVIAFVGGKYSKSIEYKDLLDWVSNSTPNPFSSQLTLSVKGSDKVIVLTLPLKSEITILEELISDASSSKNQVVDGNTLEKFRTISKNHIKTRRQEILYLEKLLEENTNVVDTWKSFVLGGGRLELES